MTEEVSKNLELAAENFRLGLAARSQDDAPQAQRFFFLAAENLLLAARASRGRLKETRLKLAQELIQEAQAIQAAPAAAAASIPPQAVSLGDDQQAASWLVRQRPDVRFDDIAGLEDVKEQIRLKLLYPFTHPEIAAQYGIRAGGGILLYGPPGTGKTLVARAVAGEINAAYFAIKPSEIMSQWVGVAEQNIARLFAEAESHALSVVFVDEIEALAPKRRTSGSTVMVRVVPQILAELDGFEKRRNPLMLVGATNEPWSIDPALLRPGRLDRLIYVPPPDLPARRRILELNLKDVPLDEQVSLHILAARSEGFSGADMAALAQRARERVFTEAVHQGSIRTIQNQDFEALLAEMRPSISPKDLKLFEKFAEEGVR